VTDPLHDERLTTAGLFFEAHAGLTALLEARFADDVPGVSMHGFEVLLRLARSPGERLRMSDLAAQVAMSPSGLTRAVDRLEAGGLVERASCPSDRRGSYAVLTPAGRDLVERAIPLHLRHLDEHFTGLLDDDELRRFTATLRKLRDHVSPTAAQVSPPATVG
jgi:MarR family 2-MHQ and catechol resistance regulon transcriptional repressor